MVNADLDESIYDSMLYQHIVDGGIEELFISYDVADPKGFVFREEKIADLRDLPLAQRPAMYSAITKEITDLARNGTFTVQELPLNRKSVMNMGL